MGYNYNTAKGTLNKITYGNGDTIELAYDSLDQVVAKSIIQSQLTEKHRIAGSLVLWNFRMTSDTIIVLWTCCNYCEFIMPLEIEVL